MAHRSPDSGPYQTAEYQKFVDSMVPHCHCKESNRPCDGVLAGGPCDGVEEEPNDDDSDEQEED